MASPMPEDLLDPTTSELLAKIRDLESRNVALEVRNIQLTKALASASTNGCDKYAVVNNYAHIIIDKHLNTISNIHQIHPTNEENVQIYNIIDRWSRSLCLEDFIYGTPELNNGVRLRPTFSIEDFIVLFDASSNTVDQKQLQKLCKKYAASLTPDRCMNFKMLRSDTRHSDALSAFLGAVVTLQLYLVLHGERPAYLYPMNAPAWTRYSVDEEYTRDVKNLNNFDLGETGPASAVAINLLDQRKRYRKY